MNYTCPTCGYLTFKEPPGSYDSCKVCVWEDDESQLRFPSTTGANSVSLIEAQNNYAKFGYSIRNIITRLLFKQNIKLYIKDLSWRQLLPNDNYEIPKSHTDYGETYSDNPISLYYWKA